MQCWKLWCVSVSLIFCNIPVASWLDLHFDFCIFAPDHHFESWFLLKTMLIDNRKSKVISVNSTTVLKSLNSENTLWTYKNTLMEVKQIELVLRQEVLNIFAERLGILFLLTVLHRLDETASAQLDKATLLRLHWDESWLAWEAECRLSAQQGHR